nr:MAG TPA: hypothetical protein [Caudoviricetes sp.]
MSYKIDSVFPNSIDDLPFISDVDIPNKNIMISIQNYIDQGDYDNASKLCNTTNITSINSDYFNMVQNRIYSLQKYLITLDRCNRVETGSEPKSPTNGMTWIDN